MELFYDRRGVEARATLTKALEQSACLITIDHVTGDLKVRATVTTGDGSSVTQSFIVPLDGYELVYKKKTHTRGR
tara:strand:- start:155 stop:379 length:225 start_codon:yes stop_codon:yes gene_type:complete